MTHPSPVTTIARNSIASKDSSVITSNESVTGSNTPKSKSAPLASFDNSSANQKIDDEKDPFIANARIAAEKSKRWLRYD